MNNLLAYVVIGNMVAYKQSSKGFIMCKIILRYILCIIMYMLILFCFRFHLKICHDLPLHLSEAKVYTFVFVSRYRYI